MSNKHHFKDSTSIAHCDYDDSSNTLKIKFHSSKMEHDYPNCPKSVYEGLKAAQSPGKYFHTNIRGKYENK